MNSKKKPADYMPLKLVAILFFVFSILLFMIWNRATNYFPSLKNEIYLPPHTEVLAENQMEDYYHGGSDNHIDMIYYWIVKSELGREELTEYYTSILEIAHKDQPKNEPSLEIYESKFLEVGKLVFRLNLTSGPIAKDLNALFQQYPDKKDIWLVMIISCGSAGF